MEITLRVFFTGVSNNIPGGIPEQNSEKHLKSTSGKLATNLLIKVPEELCRTNNKIPDGTSRLDPLEKESTSWKFVKDTEKKIEKLSTIHMEEFLQVILKIFQRK